LSAPPALAALGPVGGLPEFDRITARLGAPPAFAA